MWSFILSNLCPPEFIEVMRCLPQVLQRTHEGIQVSHTSVFNRVSPQNMWKMAKNLKTEFLYYSIN